MGKLVECKITVRDKHITHEGVDEGISEYQGEFVCTENGYTIKYFEHEGEFADMPIKILVMPPDTARIIRGGEMTYDFLLEAGKRHKCAYGTPFGILEMGVFTKKIESKMTETGGKLNLAYTFDVGGGEIFDNELLIEVKELPNVQNS